MIIVNSWAIQYLLFKSRISLYQTTINTYIMRFNLILFEITLKSTL